MSPHSQTSTPRSDDDTAFEPGLYDDHDEDAVYGSPTYSDQPKPRKRAHVLFSDGDEMDGAFADALEHVQTTVKVEAHQADAVHDDKPSSKPTTLSHVNLQLMPAGTSGIGPGSKGRPKAGDYDAPTRQVLETAIELYHALLLTKTPFPTAQQEAEWAIGVWDMACEHHNAKTPHDTALMKLVCDFSWNRECTNTCNRLLCMHPTYVGNSKRRHDQSFQQRSHLR